MNIHRLLALILILPLSLLADADLEAIRKKPNKAIPRPSTNGPKHCTGAAAGNMTLRRRATLLWWAP